MPSLFDVLVIKAKEDSDYLQLALAVSRQAQRYHDLGEKKASPSPEVVAHANNMRIVQLGEAVKRLVFDSIIDRNEILFADLTAKDVIVARDRTAHPEKNNPADLFVAVLNSGRELARAKFEALRNSHPDNPLIHSCLDALDHISSADRISPTVWTDAENYMQVVCGGHIESMSLMGKKVLNRGTDHFSGDLIERRNRLAHTYHEDGKTPDLGFLSKNADPTSLLSEGLAQLTPDNYVLALSGDRHEPEIIEIIRKWLAKEKGSPQASFGDKGGLIVAEEISRLALEKASLHRIQIFNGVLEKTIKNPDEFQKYVRSLFPDGLNDDIKESLKKLADAAEKVKNADNKATNKLLARAIGLLDRTFEPAARVPAKPVGRKRFVLHVYGV